MKQDASENGRLLAGEAPLRTNQTSVWPANLLLTLPFLLLYWADLAHHALFFDELNAWAIAAASQTLPKLFRMVHYEGHPWLWYFLLWLPSRFTHSPRAMLWVVAPVGTAIYLVVGMLSPFSRWQKVLVFLSYFVAFEYTVMNRMYGVMFLMALLYVWRRVRKPENIVGNVLLLGVMANTDMTGLLLSVALVLEYAYDRYYASMVTETNADSMGAAPVAALIYVAMVVFSVVSLLPTPDLSWQSTGHLGANSLNPKFLLRVSTNMIAAPWWPISREFPRRFWETDSQVQRSLVLLVPIVLLAYWRVLRRDKNLLMLMGLTLAFGILFADIVYVGRVRHWGIAYIAFLLCLWMQSDTRQRQGIERPRAWLFSAYALMTLSATSGAAAIYSSWTHPFSQAKAAAEWIRQNEPNDVLLVGAPDVSFASVAEELQRPVFFMECYCTDTFKLFSKQREDFPDDEVVQRLINSLDRLNSSSAIFVFWRALKPEEVAVLKAHYLSVSLSKTFSGSDSFFENHYIYRIKRG